MKKMICAVLIFMMTGQLSEIKEQSLHYGEYIEQYAIIQNVTGAGESIYSLCSDCYASIYVRDQNTILADNLNATQLSPGLFGYLAKPSDFQVEKQYQAVYSINSTRFGNGIAMSYFIIHDDAASPSISSTSASSASTDIFSNIGSEIGKGFSWALSSFFAPISAFLDKTGVISFFGGLFGIIKPIWDVTIYFLGILRDILVWMKDNVIGFISDPAAFLAVGLENFITTTSLGLIGIIILILSPVIIPVMFFELGAIFYAIFRNADNLMQGIDNMSFMSLLGDYFKAHWSLFSWGFMGLIYCGRFLSGSINTLRNVKTGTVGDAV